MTLIIITHRTQNLKYCERIISLNKGQIKDYENKNGNKSIKDLIQGEIILAFKRLKRIF